MARDSSTREEKGGGGGLRASWVVQIDPEPMPTRRASAPASMRLRACRPVTMLPQMMSSPGQRCLIHFTMATWYPLSPAAAVCHSQIAYDDINID